MQDYYLTPYKHKSNKPIIKDFYKNYEKDLHSLIEVTGYFFEIVLTSKEAFDDASAMLLDYKEQQSKLDFRDKKYNRFSLIALKFLGGDEQLEVVINGEQYIYQIEYNGSTRNVRVLNLVDDEDLGIYFDEVYQNNLYKENGRWISVGYQDLAELVGKHLDADKTFKQNKNGRI